MEIPDHPDIANALRTGYPHGEPMWPRCPICNNECRVIYWHKHNCWVIGCDECVKPKAVKGFPHCGICDSECETIYTNKAGEVVACDECIEDQDAWDYVKEFD
jgi:hypothetical protein